MFGQRENVTGHDSSAVPRDRQLQTPGATAMRRQAIVFTLYINWGSNPETWFTFHAQNTPAVSGVGTKFMLTVDHSLPVINNSTYAIFCTNYCNY